MDRSSRYADPDFISALDRYLAEELTASEADTFRASLATDTSVERVVTELQRQWHALGVAEIDTIAARAALMGHLRTDDPTEILRDARNGSVGREDSSHLRANGFGLRGLPLGEKTLRRRTLLTLVGFGTLLLVVGTLFYQSKPSKASAQRFQTMPGQRATVRLVDGSTVILAPSTTVTVTPATVDIIGEAYFTIASHASRPMVVRTRNVAIQVLGTRFLARQYPDEADSRVVVEDGRVALSPLRPQLPNNTRTVLSAQMLAQVTDSGITVTPGIATRDYTSWTHGMLVFDKVPLRNVLAELSRAYGSNVRVGDSTLARKSIILEVSVLEEPLTEVLDVVSRVVNARVTFDGNMYVLSPTSTKNVPARKSFPQPEKQYGK